MQTSVILAGKSDSHCHSTTGFSKNVVVAGTSYQNKNVRSFIILLSGEGSASFSINNWTNFFGKKKKIK